LRVRVPFAIPSADTKAFDVVALGENSLDLVALVSEYPGSNTKQRLDRFAQLPGGQMATVAAISVRLGWRARYIGSFGDAGPGLLVRDRLRAEGVDLEASWVVAGATNRLAIVLVDARSGARTVLWDRDPLLTIDPGRVSPDAIQSGRFLVVDCEEIAAATCGARHARAAGIPTMVDVERVVPGLDDLLREIDVIVAAREFPEAFTGHDDPGRGLRTIAAEWPARVVTLTLGAEGSLSLCSGREIRTRGFPVAAVDTTGAGDAFRAGLVAGCLRAPDGSIEAALEYANAVAALSCRGLGAQGAMPSAADVNELLVARVHSSVLDS
jgi:sugar/nucleoside kinase (ribokinase family)